MSGAVLFSTVSKEEPSRIEPIADMNVPGMEGAISICSLGGDELAVSLENGSVLLKIFNLDQKEKSRDLIMRGRGPDEFAAIGSIRMRREDDSSYMDFNVQQPRSLIAIKIDNLEEIKKTDYLSFEEKGEYLFNTAYLTEGRILIRMSGSEPRYRLYDEAGQLLQEYVVFPGSTSYEEGVFNHYSLLKPDGSKMVLLMDYFDKLHIVDLDGSNHFSISTSETIISDRTAIKRIILDGVSPVRYYVSSSVTDDYIYAQRYGYRQDSFRKQDYGTVIQKISWEGKLEKEYCIEEPLFSFTVDEAEGIMYGLTWDSRLQIFRL